MRLGVLFDIDGLDGGFYGYKAYKVLFGAVAAADLAGCALLDGDTNATLRGTARDYCIAIDAASPAQVDRVRRALLRCDSPGLRPAASRFIDDAAVGQEPLVLAARVTHNGDLIQYTGWVREAWDTVRKEAGQPAPVAEAAPAPFSAPAPVFAAAGATPGGSGGSAAMGEPLSAAPAAAYRASDFRADRPGCVTAYASLLFIGAALLALGGLALSGSAGMGGGEVLLFIGLAGVQLALGIGLWRMKNWARVLVIIIQALSVLLNVVVALSGELGGSGIVSLLVSLGIAIYIIRWFGSNGELFS